MNTFLIVFPTSQPDQRRIQHRSTSQDSLDHNNTDLLCDKESSLTDLPESWSHKELLHNIYGLINHGNQIIPVTHKEVYLLSRPLKAMAHLYQHTEKEVHLLSGPSELQPVNDCVAQYTPREKDQDLPQLSDAGHPQPPDASGAQKPNTDTMTDKAQLQPVDRE